MSIAEALMLAIAVLLLIYLSYSLLRGENL
jgi:K+-transporting ATPase KdpF subunit